MFARLGTRGGSIFGANAGVSSPAVFCAACASNDFQCVAEPIRIFGSRMDFWTLLRVRACARGSLLYIFRQFRPSSRIDIITASIVCVGNPKAKGKRERQ
jgi:hypothetical protein